MYSKSSKSSFYLYKLEGIDMSGDSKQLATFRLDSELWEAFKQEARRNGKSASDVLVEFVASYVKNASGAAIQQIDNLEKLLESHLDELLSDRLSPLTSRIAALEEALPKKPQKKVV